MLEMDQVSPTVSVPKEEVQAGARGRAELNGVRARIERALFVLPAFLFQLTWGWFPLVMAVVLSFTNARARGNSEFVGLENYTRVFGDPLINNLTLAGNALRVTFLYSFLTIALTFVTPIIIAILLMEMSERVQRWMMLLWFLPVSSISSTILWKYMFNREYGLLQAIVTGLGLPPMQFLNSASEQLFWLVFPSFIMFGPGLIYITILQSIPRSYFEAAEIEGASVWRKIWTISIPRIRPMIAMLLTFALIENLQAYDWPTLMTGGGGPGGTARTVVMYMMTFVPLYIGTGTAIAVLLFAIIMAIVILFRVIIKEDPDA